MPSRLPPRTIDLPSRAAGPETWARLLQSLHKQEQTEHVRAVIKVARKRLAVLARGGN